jgi:hypothetical protein
MEGLDVKSDLTGRQLNAMYVLCLMLVVFVCVVSSMVVGTRSIETGTDTRNYAYFFLSIGHGQIDTRLEPGFVLFSSAVRWLGGNVVAYQVAIFALMLTTVLVSTRQYFSFLEGGRDYLTFLLASLALLLLSPMFVNASINAVRQGLASLLIFASLLAFYQRRWWRFLVYGALASSLHYSSLIFLAVAPALLLTPRLCHLFVCLAMIIYSAGISGTLVMALSPSLHAVVMDYSADSEYRAGTRLDFVIFSCFWYLVPYLSAPLLRKDVSRKIKDGMAIYGVMLLPFFILGFGNFSNRYLLPAWLTASICMASIVTGLKMPRSFVISAVWVLSICSLVVFKFYVDNSVII